MTHSERATADVQEIVYHVFTHHRDLWTKDWEQAVVYYAQFTKNGAARLYVEEYADRERNDLLYEDCLMSFGPYPM